MKSSPALTLLRILAISTLFGCMAVSLAFAQGEPAVAPAQNQTTPAEAAGAQSTTPAPTIQNAQELTDTKPITDVTLTAVPPRLGDDGSLKGDPGQTIQAQVRIRNNSAKPIAVKTIAEDFIIGEDGKTPQPIEAGQANSLWSLASWIQISNPQNTIPPYGTVTIPIVITVPANALPGGRYAMVMNEPSAVGANGEELANVSGVTQRVGTLVYFRVNGDVKEDANIRNIKIPNLLEFGPVPISFDLENLSDIHIHPSIKIDIKNMLGQTSETIEVPTENVFPYTTRSFDVKWDRVWGFGRYKAVIQASYGDSGKVAIGEYSFWLIPYKLILAILVILLAVVGIAVSIRRHWLHRNSVESQHITLLEDRIHQLENELKK